MGISAKNNIYSHQLKKITFLEKFSRFSISFKKFGDK